MKGKQCLHSAAQQYRQSVASNVSIFHSPSLAQPGKEAAALCFHQPGATQGKQHKFAFALKEWRPVCPATELCNYVERHDAGAGFAATASQPASQGASEPGSHPRTKDLEGDR